MPRLVVQASDTTLEQSNQSRATMFYFHHPKPFIQKAVAVQIAQRRAEPLPDNRVIIVERRGPASPVPLR